MDKLHKLDQYLAKLADGGLCVAFSGGVDSAVLLKAACGAAPESTHAVTLFTPFHTSIEPRQAAIFATYCGVPHTVLELADMPAEVLENTPDRCYLCKRTLFRQIRQYAERHSLRYVLDGTNADDLGQYRPGIRALGELNIQSPLAELGFSKADVRAAAATMGLTLADKPSAPCLATRFPYHQAIDLALLPRVERIESAVRAVGPQTVRARIHGETVRLEVPLGDFPAVIAHRKELLRVAREEGFLCLTLDLEGFRSGSMDQIFFHNQKMAAGANPT